MLKHQKAIPLIDWLFLVKDKAEPPLGNSASNLMCQADLKPLDTILLRIYTRTIRHISVPGEAQDLGNVLCLVSLENLAFRGK